jgi:hypothetical protein
MSSQHVCPHCEGRGFVDWVKGAASKVGQFVAPAAKAVLRSGFVPGGGLAATAMDLAGLGVGGRMKRIKRTRRVSESSRLRADIVRSVMRDRGVDMPTASSIVKQENLWQK